LTDCGSINGSGTGDCGSIHESGEAYFDESVQAKRQLREGDGTRPDVVELRKMILRHAQMMIDLDGEYTGIRKMRKHVAWYTAGYPNSSKLRGLSNSIETMDDLRNLLTLLVP